MRLPCPPHIKQNAHLDGDVTLAVPTPSAPLRWFAHSNGVGLLETSASASRRSLNIAGGRGQVGIECAVATRLVTPEPTSSSGDFLRARDNPGDRMTWANAPKRLLTSTVG
jgi:hypothetical protein